LEVVFFKNLQFILQEHNPSSSQDTRKPAALSQTCGMSPTKQLQSSDKVPKKKFHIN
jgi:hypothetical protein